jgi:hypothetical protein
MWNDGLRPATPLPRALVERLGRRSFARPPFGDFTLAAFIRCLHGIEVN